MTSPKPSWATIRSSEQLADTPAVRHDGRWWLVAPSGTVPANDPALTHELDALADDLGAATRAVAQLALNEADQEMG